MARPEHVIRLAQLKLITDSAELEADITGQTRGYVHELYRRFRNRAAEAIAAMTYCDPDKPDELRALQNRVKVFDEFVEGVRTIINEGVNTDGEINEQEREELLDVLMQEPDGLRKAIALGLVD